MKTSCQQLTLRIANEKRINLLGTGTLILPSADSYALIFTAAHVVWDLVQEDETAHLYFDCFEADHTCHTMEGDFSLAEKTSAAEQTSAPVTTSGVGQAADAEQTSGAEQAYGLEFNRIYIPEDFDPDSLINDAAILVIPREAWMDQLASVSIAEEDIPTTSQLTGWGYPEAAEETPAELKKTDGEYELEEATLSGTVETNNGSKIKVLYQAPAREEGYGRDEEMPGYSGSALYDFSSGKEGVYIGCVSGPAGTDAHGSRIYLTSSKIFLKLMEAHGIKLYPDPDQLPESLEVYLDAAEAMIPSAKTNALKCLDEKLGDLIYPGELTASCFFANGEKDICLSMCQSCQEKGIRRCSNYWKGQLMKAFCFCILEGKELSELPKLERVINEDEAPVKIEFVCSDQNGEDFIISLLDNKFCISGKKVKDGSIFLWNNAEEDYYNSTISWEEMNNIIVSLVENESDRKRAWQLKKGIREADYDIVNGQLPFFNFAMIGVGKLVENVINDNNGNPKKMIKALQYLLENSWRES